jgi:hypothetical protein
VCVLFVPFFFQYMKKRLPGGAQNQAVFPVHIIWMHLYFYCFPDKSVRVYCFGGEKFGVLSVEKTDCL